MSNRVESSTIKEWREATWDLNQECARLESLAKLHDMQKEEALDQGQYFKPTMELDIGPSWINIVECGTPSCSLGWASKKFDAIKQGMLNNNMRMTARNFFGLTNGAYDDLFGSADKTPVEQAADIRSVIKDKQASAGNLIAAKYL